MKSTHHAHLISELKANASDQNHQYYSDSYTGSTHTFYAVPVPVRRQLLKDWLKANPELSAKEILRVADELAHGVSHEEKTMLGYLLGYRPDIRSKVSFAQLNRWLDELHGWAEVDSLCQNVFTATELLAIWPKWEKFLIKLSQDKNINKRRASLVYLTGPTSKSADERLHSLSFSLSESLAHEKDILITKAISWLLRSQIDSNKAGVATFVKQQQNILPNIALRETRKKLDTGKKN